MYVFGIYPAANHQGVRDSLKSPNLMVVPLDCILYVIPIKSSEMSLHLLPDSLIPVTPKLLANSLPSSLDYGFTRPMRWSLQFGNSSQSLTQHWAVHTVFYFKPQVCSLNDKLSPALFHLCCCQIADN